MSNSARWIARSVGRGREWRYRNLSYLARDILRHLEDRAGQTSYEVLGPSEVNPTNLMMEFGNKSTLEEIEAALKELYDLGEDDKLPYVYLMERGQVWLTCVGEFSSYHWQGELPRELRKWWKERRKKREEGYTRQVEGMARKRAPPVRPEIDDEKWKDGAEGVGA